MAPTEGRVPNLNGGGAAAVARKMRNRLGLYKLCGLIFIYSECALYVYSMVFVSRYIFQRAYYVLY